MNLQPNEKLRADVIDEVKNPVCGKLVKRDNAYIILGGDESHYFCSWECRQKYASKKTLIYFKGVIYNVWCIC
jgi:YHS domain-containing protein